MSQRATFAAVGGVVATLVVVGLHFSSAAPVRSARPPRASAARTVAGEPRDTDYDADPAFRRPPSAERPKGAGISLGPNGAIAKLALSHPELGLDEVDIAALQKTFSRHYRAFALFEAELATATANPDGSVTIQIPAFPREAAYLLDDFLNDVTAHYRGKTPTPVREALKKMYAGYTNELGTAGLDLTVRISEDPNYAYDLTRKVVFFENGQVVAVGETTDVLTRERTRMSPYAELAHYFPQDSR